MMEQEKKNRIGTTAEEAFDRQMLSGNYRIFLIVLLFFLVGAVLFVGLMPRGICIGAAALVASLAVIFLAFPLFWEIDEGNRFVRRIRRASYFPIRTGAFVSSKIKLLLLYGGALFGISLVIQLVVSPLFGLDNLLLFQGTLAAVYVVNMVFYTVIGTVGARTGE